MCKYSSHSLAGSFSYARALLYNAVPIVNTALCTAESIKRVDLMLSVPTPYNKMKQSIKGHKTSVGAAGYICCLDTLLVSQVFAYIQMHQLTHIKCVEFFVHR